MFDDQNPGHDETLSHLEFLHHWGLVVEVGGRPSPTRAAVLLFGTDPTFRQVLPRPVVDWQWTRGNWSEELPEERWTDRLVIESNLVKAWKALVDRYLQRAEKPFSLDPETLRRDDLPPDYIVFREAAINLLIHQDYADHARKPVIRFFDDRALLWNPGDAFASADELLEPGEREVRNPRIVAALRRIGLSEQAGTGIRAIFGNWRRLGRVPPIIDNDKARKAFQLTLLKEEILSEDSFCSSQASAFTSTTPKPRPSPSRAARAGCVHATCTPSRVFRAPSHGRSWSAWRSRLSYRRWKAPKRQYSFSPNISRDGSAGPAKSVTKLTLHRRTWSLTKPARNAEVGH